MLQQVALSVMQELGYVSNDVKLISTTQTGANGTQVKGYYDPKSQTSFVNDSIRSDRSNFPTKKVNSF